jgi:hypothetical protein
MNVIGSQDSRDLADRECEGYNLSCLRPSASTG